MSWHDIMSWHELHRLRIFSEFQLFLKCHFYWTSSKGHSLKDNYEIHLKYICITHCGASGPTKWPQSTLRQGLNHVTQYAFIAYRGLWNHRKIHNAMKTHAQIILFRSWGPPQGDFGTSVGPKVSSIVSGATFWRFWATFWWLWESRDPFGEAQSDSLDTWELQREAQ